MKILHLISQHPESTGSGIYLQNIMQQASLTGCRNALIAGVSDNRFPVLKCIEGKGCRFVNFGRDGLDFTIPGMSDVMPYPSSRFNTLSPAQLDRYEQAFAEIIQQTIDEFAPDIIHSHHLWLASSVARRNHPDIPMVTSCHSTELRQYAQCEQIRERVLSHCRQIDRILSLSRDQAEKISHTYSIDRDRIDIVGGGFDNALFQFQAKDQPGPVHLLYAGKLSFAKGVDWLLHVIHALRDEDVHLHLAGSGSGEEEQKCLQLAAAAGESVTVYGRVSQQQLAGLMGLCHLFILPSFYEGLPLVLLEALACGCRIVTTDLAGCRELLAEANQDLVEFIQLTPMKGIDRPFPEDLPLLEQRLQQGIGKMIERIRRSPTPHRDQIQDLTSRFGWEAVFARIEKAYAKAING